MKSRISFTFFKFCLSIFTGEILTRNEKYSLADYILNDFTVRSRLIVKSFGASDIGTYTCVGRNMFNNKGDREEADIIVNFVESKNSKLFHSDGSVNTLSLKIQARKQFSAFHRIMFHFSSKL